jgi:hypothetical protein
MLATTLLYLPVLLDLHAEWTGNLNYTAVLTLVGLLILLLANLGFWIELNGWVVLALGTIGLALAVGGGYAHYTSDEQQLLKLTANIDPRPVLTSYLGVALAGAMFLALGLLVSSWVKSQLVAWMLSLLLGLCFVLPAALRWGFDPGTFGYSVAYFLGVPEHFRRDFTRGVIDTRPLVLYVTVTFTCLYLTAHSLEARRLR